MVNCYYDNELILMGQPPPLIFSSIVPERNEMELKEWNGIEETK